MHSIGPPGVCKELSTDQIASGPEHCECCDDKQTAHKVLHQPTESKVWQAARNIQKARTCKFTAGVWFVLLHLFCFCLKSSPRCFAAAALSLITCWTATCPYCSAQHISWCVKLDTADSAGVTCVWLPEVINISLDPFLTLRAFSVAAVSSTFP